MRIQVQCTLSYFSTALEQALSARHSLVAGRVRYILVDIPRGQALSTCTKPELRSTVIISDNPCPEYKLDVLARKPAALLGRITLEELVESIRMVEAGHNVVPEVSSILTPAERFTLQLIARGHNIKEVAALRGAKASTTRNTIQVIYTKLGLRSAVQLLHYYYGNWETLRNLGVLAEAPPSPERLLQNRI